MNKGTTPSGAQQDNEAYSGREEERRRRKQARSLPLIKCAKSKKECAVGGRTDGRTGRSGRYRRHRVLIVLNNCTTMGPKYVDRKVMKGSRAKLELSVATGIEMAAVGEGEEGGEKTEEEEQEREPETELEAG